ncbi:hypothetical protein [Dyella sp. ASV21]|uniref:hypothetical protein n=1 Tax=Dyella sp. ASV21 TaxID=2795114 RepID=UPI001E448C8F|nr:hypothetical protein [Dyella sp. ASV21]
MNAIAQDQATQDNAAPGGMSWAGFKAMAVESGQWIWGTAQGAFNTKATVSQIIVDAVIGMVPLLGDATAVRDLIAVSMGLIDEPEKRNDTWEWVLLFVLLLALIPVMGGVAKGVGRLIVSAVRTGEGTAKLAKSIVEVLNHIGRGNAEQWLIKLRFADYQASMVDALNRYTAIIVEDITVIRQKIRMPESLGQRLDQVSRGMSWLKQEGGKRIPEAVKELDQKLREVQAYIRSGGETTSRTMRFEVATGEKAHTYTDEARIVENGPLPARSARGGWLQNKAPEGRQDIYESYYKHEDGYPKLIATVEGNHYPYLAAYSGRIVQRRLAKGERVYRFFGTGRRTLGYDKVPTTSASGMWWGIGEPPNTAKAWRSEAAVLDEFNSDGFLVIGHVTGDAGPKAAVGTVSEQLGSNIPGQYLPGGGIQAAFYLDRASAEELARLGKEVMATQKPARWLDPVSGMLFDIRPTGWNDAYGIHGYLHLPSQGTVQTVKLGAREQTRTTEETQ